MMQIIKKGAAAIAAGALLFSFVAPAYAGASIVISGNGNDSENSAWIRISQRVRVRQSNRARVSNWASAWANTGNNDANGNTGGNVTITTGDASASASIVNNLNSNVATIDLCCDEEKPCDEELPI